MMNKEICQEYWLNPTPENAPSEYDGPVARSEYLVNLFKRWIDPNSSILELGCNTGRNLTHLYDAGFTDVFGIEINPKAVGIFSEKGYPIPKLCGPIEQWLSVIGGKDVMFSMAVLMHIPPESEWIFDLIVEKTLKYLITIEYEEPEETVILKGRNYLDIFEPLGMEQVFTEPFNPYLNPDATPYITRVYKRCY